VLSCTHDLWTVSGRADCAPTEYCNIGFNTRIMDEHLAQVIWPDLFRKLQDKSCYFCVPLPTFLQDPSSSLSSSFSPLLSSFLLEGLIHLCEQFNIVKENTMLVGPTLEGVGLYPNLEDNLKCASIPAWTCGDASGKFRGIVSALISGYFVGKQFTKDIAQ